MWRLDGCRRDGAQLRQLHQKGLHCNTHPASRTLARGQCLSHCKLFKDNSSDKRNNGKVSSFPSPPPRNMLALFDVGVFINMFQPVIQYLSRVVLPFTFTSGKVIHEILVYFWYYFYEF